MFHWKPAAVVAISACPGAPFVAVGYETGDLELYDINIMSCIQRIVGDGIEVTCLAWALDGLEGDRWRTFAAHLDGAVSEVDWRAAALVAPTDSTGGVIWSLASQPVEAIKPGYAHQLAAACDDGAVRLFGVEGGEPGAQLERTLAVLQGRLLSCAWHPTGEAVAVGGVDGSIHMLDVTTGREMVRITASSRTANPACIWRLLVLPDGTLVSGDGEGAVQMWDGAFGTLLHRFVRHKADVLALAAAPDGSAVFAAGVDSQVAMFCPVLEASPAFGDSANKASKKESKSGAKTPAMATAVAPAPGSWSYLDYKRVHTHDVRAMDVVKLLDGRSVLVSGGLDAQLVAYSVGTFLKTHPTRLTKAPQRPMCQLASAVSAGAVAEAPTAAVSKPTSRAKGGVKAPLVEPQLPCPSRLLCTSNGACDVWQLGQHAPLGSGRGGAAAAGGHFGGGPPTTSMASRSRWQTQQRGEGCTVDLIQGPRHLAQIKLGGGNRIACSAISSDGTFVSCCGGHGTIRLYRLAETPAAATAASGRSAAQFGGAPLTVERVKVPEGTPRAVALAMTARHLAAAHPDGSVSVFELPSPSDAPVAAKPSSGSSEEEEEEESIPPPEACLVARSTAPELRKHCGEQETKHRKGQAWRAYQSPFSALKASPEGSVFAAAGAWGIHLFRFPVAKVAAVGAAATTAAAAALPPLKHLGKVLCMHNDSPVSGMAFSTDGKLLAASLTSEFVTVYDVDSGRPIQWCLDHDPLVTKCLSKLPGLLDGCSFHPDPQAKKLIVFGPGGFCHFVLDQAPDTAHMEVRRRRGRKPPTEEEKAAGSAGESRGRNGRVIVLLDPCVHAGFVANDAVLVLEKPWEDVTRAFAPPLLRHRFGGS